MEFFLALVVGLLFSAALFLMLSGVLVRFVFGFTLMGNAVNLLLFTAGRLDPVDPPLIDAKQTLLAAPAANALPQALILTAIVIGFAMTIFLLVLLYRAYDQAHTLDADQDEFISEMPKTDPSDSLRHKEQA
ncbi:MAG: NADH-quinone oxidoreductase subunit K [Desulfotignum sp.]|nr:NADH-quinone oxidoreductase subunit K [Desulfotignum sp.]MCF8113315.1 NADH-quinone oxidoreductase subunit K [Desulfotignum sp.]MCF8125778.1 NADH-quinone oxidoreductase subunit K [Desulfotignum sp.]